ncbi:hypothetical protein [Sorangium sp. So ce426]|uniref:hypothetical protein n=1 Tax=Sorangium sp. So ce426 TaxID=3133312 RepID=UPI003F5B217B
MTDDPSTSKLAEGIGAAQDPRTLPWAPNGNGPRSEAEAVELARRRGIVIPEDIAFHFRDDAVPQGAYAVYNHFTSIRRYRWSDFYAKERINVKVRRSVLESDEAIVAVIAHEMYELNALRELFEHRETIPGIEIIDMVKPGVPRNLHDRAWDAADEHVRAMRCEETC